MIFMELIVLDLAWCKEYAAMISAASDTDLKYIGTDRMDAEAARALFSSAISDVDARWDRLLVSKDGPLMGDVNLFFSQDPGSGRKSAEVNIFVAEKYRHRGLASAALEAALGEAGRRQCGSVKAVVDCENRGAMQFFVKRGFAPTGETPNAFGQVELKLSL